MKYSRQAVVKYLLLLAAFGVVGDRGYGQEHLATLQEVSLGGYRALQGIATDGDSFYTSTGICDLDLAVEAVIFKFDAQTWQQTNSKTFSKFFDPCHLGDITVDASYLYVPFSNSPNGGPYQIRRFDLDTFEEVSVWGLDELAKLYTGEITAGLDYHDGDLWLIEFQNDEPDNAHIIRINIDPLFAIADYEITTRYANGIEFFGSYIYIANGSKDDCPLGYIDVYDFEQMTPTGVNQPLTPRYSYDVQTGSCFLQFAHAEGLTFRGTELWVGSDTGDKVRRIQTPMLPPDRPQQCSYLSIESMTWADDRPGGDGDGIPEAGETVGLEICLDSTADLQNVQACLSALEPDVNIFHACNDYGLIFANQTDCGDDDFDMDLLFNSSRYVVFTLHVEYEKDGAQCYQDLNFIKYFPVQGEIEPAFEICEVVFDDVTEGCSNGDYMLQSGEHADIRIKIRNIGNAVATGVHVCLEHLDGFDCFDSHCISYPDLPPGSSCEPPTNPNNHWDICIPKNVSGTFNTNIIIQYDSPLSPQVIPFQLNITPTAWINVSPGEYDFGVAGTNELIEIPVTINNTGNEVMMVEDIVPSDPDTTWTGQSLPFEVDPGEARDIIVTIDTSMVQELGQIERSVCVVSDAHVCGPGQDDCVYITGFIVGEGEAVHIIPTPGPLGSADVSGNIIVYSNKRFGNWDVFAYDLATGQELQITDHPADQVSPRISGSLVAWTDRRNGQSDIYAYDLATDCEFVVSAEPANEGLFGVDGDYIAFRRQYYTFTDDCPPPEAGLGPYNLYIYRYDGGCPPSGEICQVTFYTGNDQHQPMQQVHSSGDLGGGTLAWRELTYSWNGNCWGLSQPLVRKMNLDGNNPCAATIVDVPCVDSVWLNSHADSGRIVYHGDFPGFEEAQIGLWQKAVGCQQITFDRDRYNEDPAIGANLIVYRKQSTGLFYWDLMTSTEHLITTEFAPAPRRMDTNVVVWSKAWDLYYSFLKEADIAVNPEGISFSNDQPYASEEFDVSVQVNNLAPWGTSDDITVELYDGHPQAGGILLATQVIFGGMDGQSQELVTFIGVVIDTPGTDPPHDICVRVVVPSGDNPANNIACKALEVLAPGACCFPDGSCDDGMTPDQCAAKGGVYQSDESQCLDVTCVGKGSCCVDGSCYDDVTAEECAAAGGTYQSDGSDCAKVECDLCPWDLDGSGTVGVSDLLSLLASWGPCKGCPADFDANGSVGVSDLLALLANWGLCP